MKRTFKKSELDGVTGYQGNNGGSMLWIPAFKYAVGKSGYETEESQCSESCCIRDGDTPITGELLVAALRERGVEVIDDTVGEKIIDGLQGFKDELEAKAKPEVDEWGKFELAESPTYHRMGDMVDVHYSDGELMHHKPWTNYANCNWLWRPLTPAEVEAFKAKIASHAKPEVKPTVNEEESELAYLRRHSDELRKELDEAKATIERMEYLAKVQAVASNGKDATITRLRDSLTKAENDRQQPPMSDERFRQEAAMKVMCGVVASIPTNERQKEVDNIAEVNGMSVYELVADVSMRYAAALLSALRKEQQ